MKGTKKSLSKTYAKSPCHAGEPFAEKIAAISVTLGYCFCLDSLIHFSGKNLKQKDQDGVVFCSHQFVDNEKTSVSWATKVSHHADRKPTIAWTDRMKAPLWKSWPRHDALVTHIRVVGMTSETQRNMVVKELHIRPEPFAEGAMRYAFPAADQEGRRFVLKVPCWFWSVFVCIVLSLFTKSAAWSGGME